jgi:hypothetical protein
VADHRQELVERSRRPEVELENFIENRVDLREFRANEDANGRADGKVVGDAEPHAHGDEVREEFFGAGLDDDGTPKPWDEDGSDEENEDGCDHDELVAAGGCEVCGEAKF